VNCPNVSERCLIRFNADLGENVHPDEVACQEQEKKEDDYEDGRLLLG
jgi:hypothetical protein